MAVKAGCTPRSDVLEGELNDAIFAASFGRLVRNEGPAEVGDRRPIAVQIDRYYVGQHGDGVDTLRRWEPASSAVPSYFRDPPI